MIYEIANAVNTSMQVDTVHRAGCQNCVAIGKADGVLMKIKTSSLLEGQQEDRSLNSHAIHVGLAYVNETDVHRRSLMHVPFRKEEPEVRYTRAKHACPNFCTLVSSLDYQVVAAHYALTDEKLVDQAHEKGKLVYSWTANQHWMMRVM